MIITDITKESESKITANWIVTREQNDAEPAIIRKCSRCGSCLPKGMVGTNYCSNCGAKGRKRGE